MPNLEQSPVYVGNIRIILFKLWHNSVSMGTWMLTKTSEAPWSLFLIQQSFPSFLPKVFTKYNYISLVEMKQNLSVVQGYFIFFKLFIFVLFYLWVFFCLFVWFSIEGQRYFSKKNLLQKRWSNTWALNFWAVSNYQRLSGASRW